MKKKLASLLTDVGFSQKEAAVYLALSSLGEATASEVAKKADIKRPTVYATLETLKARGFVHQTKQKGQTKFLAEKPDAILLHAKTRAARLEAHLDFFRALFKGTRKHPRIFFYSGPDGFKMIWKKLFSSGISEYLIMTDPQEMTGFVKESYITDTIIREKKKRGIKSRQILSFSEYGKKIMEKDALENRASKMMPHLYRFPFTTIIFGDHVALISPLSENFIVIIESEAYAKSQRAFFEALWSLLPAVKRPL